MCLLIQATLGSKGFDDVHRRQHGEKDGHMLAKWTEGNYPQVKIVLTSGYSKAKKEVMEDQEHQFPLIRKPYSIEKLTEQISITLAEEA